MLDSASAARRNHEGITLNDAGWTGLDVVVKIQVYLEACPRLSCVLSGHGTSRGLFKMFEGKNQKLYFTVKLSVLPSPAPGKKKAFQAEEGLCLVSLI